MRSLWFLKLHVIYLVAASKNVSESQTDYIPIIPESEIIAIDSQHDALAVATLDHIYLLKQTEYGSSLPNGQLLGSIILPQKIIPSSVILVKLLSRLQVFYCDHFICNFCTVSNHNTSCAVLDRALNAHVPILSVAVARSPENLFVRIIDHKQKAVILRYDVQDQGNATAQKRAVDVGFIGEQMTVLGFARTNYVYFVGSSQQPNEPLINAKLGEGNVSLAKITRICSQDETDNLESRIDISLSCENMTGEVESVSSAFYDPKLDQLLVTMKIKDKSKHIVCLFDMVEADKQFNKIWELCQRTSLNDGRRDCEGASNIEQLERHCYVMTHNADTTQSCVRFGLDPNEEYLNCELHRRASSSYRYGWLEDYVPFIGKRIIQLSNIGSAIDSIVPDHTNSAVFLSYVINEQERTVIRVRSETSVKGDSDILWSSTTSSPIQNEQHQIMALGSNKNWLYMVNDTKVLVLPFTCFDLYKTCDSLAAGGWKDPLSCVWCADEGKNRVVNSHDKFACSQPLTQVCPPTVDHANRDENYLEWQVFGTNLNRLQDSTVYVCDEPCIVNRSISNNLKLHCFLKSGQDASCSVKIGGKLGNYNSFVMNVPKVTNSVGVETEQSQHKKSSNKAWKAVVAVVVVILILLALAVLVWLARNKFLQPRGKRNGLNGSTVGFNMSSPNMAPPSNTYVDPEGLRLEPINLTYERLFQDIDDRLKIDVSNLRFEIQIGKGHFGVVNRATYVTPDGVEKKVACKMIKEGVSGVREFISEGLVMDRFDHPRVMQLIGIAFTDNKFPIIVTDYMKLGDLVTYLRDRENAPTLRNLLQFAVQIAEGMEYLHSCNFIHRDLAARNCMLDSNLGIKIADFGLCRECNRDNIYEPSIKNRDLPLRWMAVEALQDEKFTFQGDIWAYGIVLWELMTRGMIPYGTLTGYPLLDFLRKGHRLDLPPYCPTQLYNDIMLACWNEVPEERPSFSDLVVQVNDLVRSMENSQNTQLYSHYEKVSSLAPSTQDTGSSGKDTNTLF